MADYMVEAPPDRPPEIKDWEEKRKGKKLSELKEEEVPSGYTVTALTSDKGEERWALRETPGGGAAPPFGMTPGKLGQYAGKIATTAAGGPSAVVGEAVPQALELGAKGAQAVWNMLPEGGQQFIAGAVPGVAVTAELLAEQEAEAQAAVPTVEGPVPAGAAAAGAPPGVPGMPGMPGMPGAGGFSVRAGGRPGQPGAAARIEKMGQEQLGAAETAEAEEELYRQELGEVATQRAELEQMNLMRQAENVEQLAEISTAAYSEIMRTTSLEDIQQEAAANRQESESRLAKLNEEFARAGEEAIDAHGRFSASGPKAMATLAIIFGGLGSALTGEPNRALQLIMDTISSDVSFQKGERDAKRKHLGQRMDRESEYMDRLKEITGDEVEAKMLERREKMSIYENHLEYLAQTHKAEDMRAFAGDVLLGLREQKAQINMEMDQHAYNREAKARATAIEAATKASQERRGWAQIQMQRDQQRAKQRLASYANAKEITMIEEAQELVQGLTEQYRNLPTRALREIEALVPFAETDTKKYTAAIETLARPWYRMFLKDRMSDKDADWATEKAFASVHENKNVGLARMESTLKVMEMVKQGRTAAMQAAGMTMLPSGEVELDRDKFTKWLDQAAGAAE